MIRPSRRSDRRGVALLVAIGILVILALLGSVFATMSGIERTVARNYIDKVRARLTAQAGVEHAIALLYQPDQVDMWRVDRNLPWLYYGGDRNANGKMDGGDIDEDKDGFPDREKLSVTKALSPSFYVDEDGDGLPDLVQVDDRQIGFSGRMDYGTYGPDLNLYSIRVRDLGSKINVNNVHPNLKKILENLFMAIDLSDAANVAKKIVDSRPPEGYADPNHLYALLGKDIYDKIKTYVTTVGWVDPREVAEPRRIPRPVPLSGGYRRRDLALGKDIYSRWELRPTLKYEEKIDGPSVHGPRTPIDINDAPIEVLVALLQDLKGFYAYEDKFTTHTYDYYGMNCNYDGTMPDFPDGDRVQRPPGKWLINGRVGTIYETTPIPAGRKPTSGSSAVPNGDGAWGIAYKIIEERNKEFKSPPGFTFSGVSPKTKNLFRNFQQFNEFVDSLDPKLFRPISGWNLPKYTLPLPRALAGKLGKPANEIPMIKDVIKANFNPNAHFSSLNPNEILGVWIDKANLTYHTFEFSFYPMGFFEIQSAGWVLHKDRKIVAEEVVTTAVKLFEVYRDTTQWDFMREWASTDVGLSKVFSSAGGNLTTPANVSLWSYPEFQVKTLLQDPNLSHEGYIALNTIRSMKGTGAQLAVRFDYEDEDPYKTLPSDIVDPVEPKGSKHIQDETATAFTKSFGPGPWIDRLIGGVKPGSVANDGIISEVGSSPGYLNDNLNQHQGTVSFWVKPCFQPENTGRQRAFMSSFYYQSKNDKGDGWSFPFGDWMMAPFIICFTAQHTDGPFSETIVKADSKQKRKQDNYIENQEMVKYNNAGTTWPERSIAAGFGGRFNHNEINGGIISPTINHVGHGHTQYTNCNNTWGNFAMCKRWMHVGFVWQDSDEALGNKAPNYQSGFCEIEHGCFRFYINGKMVGNKDYKNTRTLRFSNKWINNNPNSRWGITDDPIRVAKEQGCAEPPPLIRIGAEANPPLPGVTITKNSIAAQRKLYPISNYTADATIDEFVLWQEEKDGNVTDAWVHGRYYKENEATFTSPKVDLKTQIETLPPKGTAPPPTSLAEGSMTTIIPAPVTRMAFIACTGYWTVNLVDKVNGEDRDEKNDPYDPAKQNIYKTMFWLAIADPNDPAHELMPMQRVPLGGTAVTNNPDYSTDPKNNPGKVIEISGAQFRYKVRIDSNYSDDKQNTPLTVSPILDDVTVAYFTKMPSFYSWSLEE